MRKHQARGSRDFIIVENTKLYVRFRIAVSTTTEARLAVKIFNPHLDPFIRIPCGGYSRLLDYRVLFGSEREGGARGRIITAGEDNGGPID